MDLLSQARTSGWEERRRRMCAEVSRAWGVVPDSLHCVYHLSLSGAPWSTGGVALGCSRRWALVRWSPSLKEWECRYGDADVPLAVVQTNAQNAHKQQCRPGVGCVSHPWSSLLSSQ